VVDYELVICGLQSYSRKIALFLGGRQAIDPLSSVVSDGCGSWAPPNAALNVGIFSKKQGNTPGCEGGQR